LSAIPFLFAGEYAALAAIRFTSVGVAIAASATAVGPVVFTPALSSGAPPMLATRAVLWAEWIIRPDNGSTASASGNALGAQCLKKA